jgi:hypothetical protein
MLEELDKWKTRLKLDMFSRIKNSNNSFTVDYELG